MYLIYKNGEIVERAESLRYIKHQENGVAVISTPDDYDAVYSAATDQMYPLAEYGVEQEDDAAALRAENKLLKEQVSALSTQADFHEECLVEMANIVYA